MAGLVGLLLLSRVAVPAAIVAAYLAVVLAVGPPAGWRDVGVPGETPSFLDLRSVTWAWECESKGIDVVPGNPCDPLHRPANYPRVWLLPAHLGLGPGDTVPLGIAIGVLFLLTAIALSPRDVPLWCAAVFGAFLCTPGIMLGVERGNVDLLLFCLVALAVFLYSRSQMTASALLILGAAVLKLFPILATPLLVQRSVRRAILVVLVFAAYAAATFDDVRAILRAVPKAGSYSYGLDILGHPVSQVLGVGDRFVWDAVLAVAAIAAAVVLVRRLQPSRPASRFEVDAFVTGASMYVLSYTFFRSFDYRLAFLLLTLPLLLRRASERYPEAVATLAAMFATLWLERRSLLPAGVFAQYALFVLLLAQLTRLALSDPRFRAPRRA